MALIRLGKMAIDWQRVYAARVVAMDFYGTSPAKILLFADVPHMPVGEPLAEAEHGEALRAWGLIKSDGRFTIHGSEYQIAIDMSKVCGIGLSDDSQKARVTFDLGNTRSATIDIDAAIASKILDTIPEAPEPKQPS